MNIEHHQVTNILIRDNWAHTKMHIAGTELSLFLHLLMVDLKFLFPHNHHV